MSGFKLLPASLSLMYKRTSQTAEVTPASQALVSADWRRLNWLLAQAMEVEVTDRVAWLATLEPTNGDLLPLLKHLLARPSTAKQIETADMMPRLRSDTFDRSAGAHVDEQSGDQVGPYRLLRELGRGGMGTVWLAERPDHVIERQVAIKLPRGEWTDRGLADRMARERAALAALNHPNITQLYDAGWANDGRPYLALEYVEGDPIDAWCRSAPRRSRANRAGQIKT